MVFPEFNQPFAEVPLEPVEPQYCEDRDVSDDASWVDEYETPVQGEYLDPAEWDDSGADEEWLEDEY